METEKKLTLQDFRDKFTWRSEPHQLDNEVTVSINWERIANEWAEYRIEQQQMAFYELSERYLSDVEDLKAYYEELLQNYATVTSQEGYANREFTVDIWRKNLQRYPTLLNDGYFKEGKFIKKID